MWQLVQWIAMGAVVGWIVSLILGRDFRGGCITYVIVGIVTMVVLGLLIRVFWALLVIALLLMAVVWLAEHLRLR